MTEEFIITGLVLIYATGCMATIAEIYDQQKTGMAPSGAALAVRHPALSALVTVAAIASWPLVLTWCAVRKGWR